MFFVLCHFGQKIIFKLIFSSLCPGQEAVSMDLSISTFRRIGRVNIRYSRVRMGGTVSGMEIYSFWGTREERMFIRIIEVLHLINRP